MEKKAGKPRYSICMCNYNMADTIEQSLTSILDQLDDDYEVLVVDDGSDDDSVSVIKAMQSKYPGLRLVELKRDRKRKLGFTRNVAIQEAQGDYVLLHLDCDDIYAPYIKDFVQVFHQIENCLQKDVLISGHHINMGKRSFLLSHGPYRNLFRGEDRDLWARMAALDSYIPLEHKDFVTRLPKTTPDRIHRVFIHSWDQVVYDFRTGLSLSDFMRHEVKKWYRMSFPLKVFRLMILLPAYIRSKFCEPITYTEDMNTFEKFAAYRDSVRGSFETIMKRKNCTPDFTVLSEKGKEIFS